MGCYPEWVAGHKRKGTEIRKIGESYYLYEITSRWDKKKKRAVKVTKGYIGRIAEAGLIKSKRVRTSEIMNNIQVKEYGASEWILQNSADIVRQLQEYFPAWWKELLAMACFRLLHCSPLRHMETHYHGSFISERVSRSRLGSRSIAECLREVGCQRSQIVAFMQRFVGGSEFVLIDAMTYSLNLRVLQFKRRSKV